MRNDFQRKPSSSDCVFGELAPKMSSQKAMILSLFDFKESITGHRILSLWVFGLERIGRVWRDLVDLEGLAWGGPLPLIGLA